MDLVSIGHGAWSHMGGWWAMIVMWTTIAGVAVVVALGTRPRAASPPTAAEILDERYARGDIEHDEYRQRRSELGSG